MSFIIGDMEIGRGCPNVWIKKDKEWKLRKHVI